MITVNKICCSHTEKIFERKSTGGKQKGRTYYSCEICFHGINETAVIKENTTKFKCPAGSCDASQNFKDFIKGMCCKSAARKIEYGI